MLSSSPAGAPLPLDGLQVDDAGVHLGASVSLTRVMESFQQLAAALPPHQVSGTAGAESKTQGVSDAGNTGMQPATEPVCSLSEKLRRAALLPPPRQTSTLRAVVEQLRWFAGPPIRNAAALGGNICTASPISGAPHSRLYP